MSRDRAIGVTGRTGAAAADALLRCGQPVRVVVRDPAKGRPWAERGAEVAVADLTDLASMTKALIQIQGAYVVSPQHDNREDHSVLSRWWRLRISAAPQLLAVPHLREARLPGLGRGMSEAPLIFTGAQEIDEVLDLCHALRAVLRPN